MSEVKNILKKILVNDLANFYKLYSENFKIQNKNIIFTLQINESDIDLIKDINEKIKLGFQERESSFKPDFLMTSHTRIKFDEKKIMGQNVIAKHIIPIASGKGGVGKSTTAINLALAIQSMGNNVGILDADIYGPSLPMLTGINSKPIFKDKKIIPQNAFGLQSMSIGFLLPEDTATIWRGPMVMSAINQLLSDVSWKDLDFLIIDMPPGTGDAQLTLSQKVQLAGAVIISTPQDLSLIDARKGLNMFKKVNVPILGIIENMSYFLCNKCNEKHQIFGHGGAEKEAKKLGLPFLGGIPIDIELRSSSDQGKPLYVKDFNNIISKIYLSIAKSIIKEIEKNKIQKPNIVLS